MTVFKQIKSISNIILEHPIIERYLPITKTLAYYNGKDFSSDATAGIIVAIMLIPQSMAYALLAGLPAQMGLYASILPLIAYAIFGTSRALAVGPVAIVSLMVASTLAPFSDLAPLVYASYAIALALLSGLLLLLLGFLRLGFIANFMSHPVISGFTSAAALIIGFSQFKHLLGVSIDRSHLIPNILWQAFNQIPQINITTLSIAIATITILVARNKITAFLLKKSWITAKIAAYLPRAMPLVVVTLSTLVSWMFHLSQNAGVEIVGAVPAGLPAFQTPVLDQNIIGDLLPGAVLISIVGFLESISIAKSLGAKRRRKILPNQELIGLGMANISSAMTGGFPVTGGFSRSVVNFNAGARTPIGAVFTAIIIALVLIFFTPLLHHLPKAVLASVIIVAIGTLVNFKSFQESWAYNKADGTSFLITFFGVLSFGVEMGLLLGISVSLGLYLWRTSRPHMAIVGRVQDTEHFRNILRHDVRTYEKLILLRVDESLYFANTSNLEDKILQLVADHCEVKDLVLICSAVNEIDASALDTLKQLTTRLRDAKVTLHLAEVKGPVMDRLKNVRFAAHLKPGQVFLSTHDAVDRLCKTRKGGCE